MRTLSLTRLSCFAMAVSLFSVSARSETIVLEYNDFQNNFNTYTDSNEGGQQGGQTFVEYFEEGGNPGGHLVVTTNPYTRPFANAVHAQIEFTNFLYRGRAPIVEIDYSDSGKQYSGISGGQLTSPAVFQAGKCYMAWGHSTVADQIAWETLSVPDNTAADFHLANYDSPERPNFLRPDLHPLTFGLARSNGVPANGPQYTIVGGVDNVRISIVLADPGDTNADGRVNFDDLLTLAQNYGTDSDLWSSGDFNGDDVVSFDDLLALAQRYQGSALLPPEANAQFTSDWMLARSLVPEPSLVGLLFVARRNRRA